MKSKSRRFKVPYKPKPKPKEIDNVFNDLRFYQQGVDSQLNEIIRNNMLFGQFNMELPYQPQTATIVDVNQQSGIITLTAGDED